jgi:hypothetical protein
MLRHGDTRDELVLDVVTYPVCEHLVRAIAIAENDHDIASGIPVDGELLDELEAFDRRVRRAVDRAVLGAP